MARKIEINADGGGFTALTVNSSCTGVTTGSIAKYTSITTGNDWDTIVTGTSADADAARLTAATNNSTSSRSGYGLITYTVNGNTCSNIIHLVQAGKAGCSCSDITSFPDVSTIEIPATSPYSYTLSPYAESCNMYIQNNNDWLTVTKNSSNIVFTATGAATAYRSGFVYIQTEQGGSVCKTLSVEQYPDDCTITFNMDEYQPNYIDPDFFVLSCDGTVGGAFNVYRKSDHYLEGQYCCNPDDNQTIEHTLRFLPEAEPNTTEDDIVYEYEYDGTEFNASHYEGVYVQAPCENPSIVCISINGYDSGYPDYDVNHHTWVEITDGNNKEYRSLTVEAKIRTWNGSPDNYTDEWITVTAFHEFILHIEGSGASAFQVGDQVMSIRCGTVKGQSGNAIPVDDSCSSGCE